MTPNVAILGAGASGLFAAHLLARQNYRVTLLESHSSPGGCASFFYRPAPGGRALFDAGATVLNQMAEGQFLHRMLRALEVYPLGAFESMSQIFYHIDNHPLWTFQTTDTLQWVQSILKYFPQDYALAPEFYRWAKVAQALQSSLERIPHLPLEKASDLCSNLRLLPSLGPCLPLFLKGLTQSQGDHLQQLGASSDLRRWMDMQLLITLQTSSDQAHPLWAAMALNFYPLGSGTLRGGMRSLFVPLLKSLQKNSLVRVELRSKVVKIHRDKAFSLSLENGEILGPFQHVVSSLPRFNTQALFSIPIDEDRYEYRQLKKQLWSATTAYFLLQDHQDLPNTAFNLHTHWRGEESYFSFSARDDEARAPKGLRVATASSHTRPLDQNSLVTAEKKQEFGAKHFKEGLLRSLPKLKILSEEYGTPQTFFRYTGREGGSVGGLPLNKEFTLFKSPSQRMRLPGLFQIGDTSFPGQSVFACAIGACAVTEKITGQAQIF